MPDFTLVTCTLKITGNTAWNDKIGEDLYAEIRDDIDSAMEELAKDIQEDYPMIRKVVWNF